MIQRIKAFNTSANKFPPASVTTKAPASQPILVAEKEAAYALGVATITLRGWRLAGKPVPRWTRLGSRVLYDRASLNKFVADCLNAQDGEV